MNQKFIDELIAWTKSKHELTPEQLDLEKEQVAKELGIAIMKSLFLEGLTFDDSLTIASLLIKIAQTSANMIQAERVVQEFKARSQFN
jgi:hypothetical protein